MEKEAAKQQKANGSGDMDLVKMIQQNQEKRGRNFVDELEAKFTGPAAKKGKNINKKSKTLESKKSAQPKDEGSSGSDWGGLSGDDVGKSGSEEEVKPKAGKKSSVYARGSPFVRGGGFISSIYHGKHDRHCSNLSPLFSLQQRNLQLVPLLNVAKSSWTGSTVQTWSSFQKFLCPWNSSRSDLSAAQMYTLYHRSSLYNVPRF